MYCPKCGKKNQENAVFCEECGTELTPNKSASNKSGSNKPGPKNPSKVVVVLGYIFALLGGLIGLIIGVYLYTRDNTNAKFHGRNVIIIAAVVMILGMVVPSLYSQSLSLPFTNQVATQQFTNDQFSFNYPKNWTVNSSVSDTTGSMVWIMDPQYMADPNGEKVAGILVMAANNSMGYTNDGFNSLFTQQLFVSYNKTGTSSINVDGVSATQTTYDGDNDQNHKSQAQIITWQKGDKFYVIASIVRGSDIGNTLNTQKANLDAVINSFKSK